MAMYHKTVTLGASAVSLYEHLYGATVPTDGRDVTFRWLSIQGEAANAAAYIGGAGGAALTSTDYGLTLAAASVTPVNFGAHFAGPFRLSDVFMLGTATNKFHLHGILN